MKEEVVRPGVESDPAPSSPFRRRRRQDPSSDLTSVESCPCGISVYSAGVSNSLSCPTCVSVSLAPWILKQDEARQQRDAKREWCREELLRLRQCTSTNTSRGDGEQGCLSELGKWKHDLDEESTHCEELGQQCRDVQVQHAKRVVQNDAEENELSLLEERLQNVSSAVRGLYHGHVHTAPEAAGGGLGLVFALRQETLATEASCLTHRFNLALQAFAMHRLDVGRDYHSRDRQPSSARGIGKIGGLPLPHAGPALYGALPPGVLASALRMVGSLTYALSKVLLFNHGSTLPHPILLTPPPTTPTNPTSSTTMHNLSHASNPTHAQVSTTNSWSLRGVAAKALSRALGSSPPSSSTTTNTPPVHHSPTKHQTAKQEQKRKQKQHVTHASFLVLQERPGSENVYILNPLPPNDETKLEPSPTDTHTTTNSKTNSNQDPSNTPSTNETTTNPKTEDAAAAAAAAATATHALHFAIGLQLLQNNVIALCIRAGVPVDTLWPAESLLLNLHALRGFCKREVRAGFKLGLGEVGLGVGVGADVNVRYGGGQGKEDSGS